MFEYHFEYVCLKSIPFDLDLFRFGFVPKQNDSIQKIDDEWFLDD